MISAIRVARRQSHAVGHGIGVTIHIIANKNREWPRRLQIYYAAELEITHEHIAMLWRRNGEVSNKAVSHVLHCVGSFQRALVETLRRADESGKRPIVAGVRRRVVGIEAEVFAKFVTHGKRGSVVLRVARAVKEIH